MSIYNDLQGLASGLFEQFRQGDNAEALQYIQLVPSASGTPENPGEPGIEKTPIAATARNASQKYVDGKNILATDMQITFGVQSFVPSVKDFFEVDGTRFKIVAYKPIPPTGPTISNVIFIRE